MMNIAKALTITTGQITQPVTMTVIGKMKKTYRSKQGTEQPMWVVVVADLTSACKMLVYSEDSANRLRSGKTFMITKILPKVTYFTTNASTKFYNTKPLVVPDAIQAEAERILTPPTAEFVQIKEALNSQVSRKLSVKGRVVMDEPISMVSSKNGESIPIRNIKLQDDSGAIPITLWRQHTNAVIKPGQHVSFTDMYVTRYNSNIQLGTTQNTQISVSDTAPARKIALEILGVDRVEEFVIALFTKDQQDEYMQYTVDEGVFKEFLLRNDLLIDELDDPVAITGLLPLKVNITAVEEHVTAVMAVTAVDEKMEE